MTTQHAGVESEIEAILSGLGHRAMVGDLYGPEGAPYYEALADIDTSEVREVIGAIAGRPGDVLELAAGTGRLTIPLLATGRSVTALDLSADMLQRLALRLGALSAAVRARCEIVHRDMTAFDLGRTFGVIVLGGDSITLAGRADRRSLFGCVRRHLEPGGTFLVTAPATRMGNESAGAHHQIMTRSRSVLDVYEYRTASEERRTVVVIPKDRSGPEVPILTSSPFVVNAGMIRSEAAREGLDLLSSTAVRLTPAGRGQILLTMAAAP